MDSSVARAAILLPAPCSTINISKSGYSRGIICSPFYWSLWRPSNAPARLTLHISRRALPPRHRLHQLQLSTTSRAIRTSLLLKPNLPTSTTVHITPRTPRTLAYVSRPSTTSYSISSTIWPNRSSDRATSSIESIISARRTRKQGQWDARAWRKETKNGYQGDPRSAE